MHNGGPISPVDGKLDLSASNAPLLDSRTAPDRCGLESFSKAFRSLNTPVLDWRNPNLQFIDLTVYGFPDLLSARMIFLRGSKHFRSRQKAFAGLPTTASRGSGRREGPEGFSFLADATELPLPCDISGTASQSGARFG